MQGFDEYGYLSIGTAGLCIASWMLTDSTVLQLASSAAIGCAAGAAALITPFWYEGAYNQQLKDTLLVY